ncbi:hypothetical protein vseg_013431 [Gypsophila vaccaria]
MDPQTLIFDVSSDEEFGFDGFTNGDDFDWISKLLEDVTGDTDTVSRNSGQADPISVETAKICDEIDVKSVESGKICNGFDVDDDDDDDVVVVGEVIVKPKRAKRSFFLVKNGGVDDDDDDDDCVVLECDPDKPPRSLKTAVDEVKDDEDDNSDDLVVVSEKGQVACRDFPHSRHLCVNFPFSSTSHESRCELCHCYVCDSLAPCAYWGSGALGTDHCHATDKAVYWQTERRKFRQLKNPSLPAPKPVVSSPQFPQHAQASPRPCLISRNGGPMPFGTPNIVSGVRGHRPLVTAVTRNRYQPHLVSRQLVRACSTNAQGNQVEQLAPRMTLSRPIFKRPGFSTRPVVPNRAAYCSPDNVSVAFSHQQQLVSKPVENSSANLQVPTPRLVRNPVSHQSNTRTFPPHVPGYILPTRHTQTMRPGCGQPTVVASNYRYTNPSLHQAQSVSSPLIPCNTSSALNRPQSSHQQHLVGTQSVSVPDFPCSTPDMLSNIPQMSHQALGVTQECSTNPGGTLNAPNCNVQTPQVEAEVAIKGSVLPMEKDSQTALDFDVDSWLDENGGDASFFDMSSQPSQTVPIDTAMLFFDFETSWQGLAHS